MTDKDHVPIGALKRLAEDLNSSRQKSEIFNINKKRINDFIQSPYYTSAYKPLKRSDDNTSSNKHNQIIVPGINLYPDYKDYDGILQLQNKSEFQSCLGSRSRFGDGDGSFFDAFLVHGASGVSKTSNTKPNRKGKNAIDLPKVIPRNGPLHGIKNHYMFYKTDPLGEKRRNITKTYEQLRQEHVELEKLEIATSTINPSEARMSSFPSANADDKSGNDTKSDALSTTTNLPPSNIILFHDQPKPTSHHSLSKDEMKMLLESKQQARIEMKIAHFEQYRDIQRQQIHSYIKQPVAMNIIEKKDDHEHNVEDGPIQRRLSNISKSKESSNRVLNHKNKDTECLIDPVEIATKMSLCPSSSRTRFLNDCLSQPNTLNTLPSKARFDSD